MGFWQDIAQGDFLAASIKTLQGGPATPEGVAPEAKIQQFPNILAPNQFGKISTISSFSYAQLVDLLSDGPIDGLVNKFGEKVSDENIFEGIYLNENAVKESSTNNNHLVQIKFLTDILKKMWNCDENEPSVVLEKAKPLQRILSNSEISDKNFYQKNNNIKITSYHPDDSIFAYIDELNLNKQDSSMVQRAFSLSPIVNEAPFLTVINIPQFILYLPKNKFDPNEGGINSPYPLKMDILNLSDYVYFSINYETLNSFNYFELPRSFIFNNVTTSLNKKTFQKIELKQDVSNQDFYKFQVSNINILIWSIYNFETGIKKIPEVLDRYFQNILIYQNTPSLFNYNLVDAEYRSGSQIQTPLSALNCTITDIEYNKELVGPFKLSNSFNPKGAFDHGGVVRMTSLDVGSVNAQLENETSDDVRSITYWPVEYTANSSTFLIKNTNPNYATFDAGSRNRSCQEAVPITHFISNPNVEEVVISLQINQLMDTNHIDLVDPAMGQLSATSCGGRSTKPLYTYNVPETTPTYGQINGAIPITSQSNAKGYFLLIRVQGSDLSLMQQVNRVILGTATPNFARIIAGGRTFEKALENTYKFINDNYFRNLLLASNFGAYNEVLNNRKYIDFFLNYITPTLGNFSLIENIDFANLKNSMSQLETIINSKNDIGEYLYNFALRTNEYLSSQIGLPNSLSFKEYFFTNDYRTSGIDQSFFNTNTINYYNTIRDIQADGYIMSIVEYDYVTSSFTSFNSKKIPAVSVKDFLNLNEVFLNFSDFNKSGDDVFFLRAAELQPNISSNKYPNILDTILGLTNYLSNVADGKVILSKSEILSKLNDVIIVGFTYETLKDLNLILIDPSSQKEYITIDNLEFLLSKFAIKTEKFFTEWTPSITNKISDNAVLSAFKKTLDNTDVDLVSNLSNIYDFAIFKRSNFLQLSTSISDYADISKAYVKNELKYDVGNVYLKNILINDINDKYDYLINYRLYDGVIDKLIQQKAVATSYEYLDLKDSQAPVARCGDQIANIKQSIAAGARLPSVVSIRVDTGYELTQENFEEFGQPIDCYYFSCRYDIFGMATEAAQIDLGKRSYQNITACRLTPIKSIIGENLYYTTYYNSFSLATVVSKQLSQITTGYFLFDRGSIDSISPLDISGCRTIPRIMNQSGIRTLDYYSNQICNNPFYNFNNFIGINGISGLYCSGDIFGLQIPVLCSEVINKFCDNLKSNLNFIEISCIDFESILNSGYIDMFNFKNVVNSKDTSLTLIDYNKSYSSFNQCVDSKSVYSCNINHFDTYIYYNSANGAYCTYDESEKYLKFEINNFIIPSYTTSTQQNVNPTQVICSLTLNIPTWIVCLPNGDFYLYTNTYGDSCQEKIRANNEYYLRFSCPEIACLNLCSIFFQGFCKVNICDQRNNKNYIFDNKVSLLGNKENILQTIPRQGPTEDNYFFTSSPSVVLTKEGSNNQFNWISDVGSLCCVIINNDTVTPFYAPIVLENQSEKVFKFTYLNTCIARYKIEKACFPNGNITSEGFATVLLNTLRNNKDLPSNINLYAKNSNQIRLNRISLRFNDENSEGGDLSFSLFQKNVLNNISTLASSVFPQNLNSSINNDANSVYKNVNFYFASVTVTNKSSSDIFDRNVANKISLPPAMKTTSGKDIKRFVRVTKLSHETLSTLIFKKISLLKVSEIIPQNFYYPFSAIAAVRFDSRAFSSIPNRSYDCKFKKVLVPSNYFPNDENGKDIRYLNRARNNLKKIYVGDWDGTFKLSWTNNPAWIIMDMLINRRYGLGNYIESDQVDIWELYKIARWCDNVDYDGYYYGVPDGYGGTEPRHAFNAVINENYNVFDMITQIASIFRGHVFYMNSMITFDDDRIKPVMGEFNNNDVKDGLFNYSNFKKDNEYTALDVAYMDERDSFKPKTEYVEDIEGIRTKGLLKKQVNAFGITSRGQARRFAKYILFQTAKENSTVQFTTDQRALLYKPGDLLRINDELKTTEKNFGFVRNFEDINSECFSIILDSAIDDQKLSTKEISLFLPMAKPRAEDVQANSEFIPKEITFNAYCLLNSLDYLSNNSVQDPSIIALRPTEIKDQNSNFMFTGNYQGTLVGDDRPIICFTARYVPNKNILNETVKYGHWILTTGSSQNNNYYAFDNLCNAALKYQIPHGKYFFEYFDYATLNCIDLDPNATPDLIVTGYLENGNPLFTCLPKFKSLQLSSNVIKDMNFNVIEYLKPKISYAEVIENDRPSIETFSIVSVVGTGGYYETNCNFEAQKINEYTCLIISKYECGLNRNPRIKDSLAPENGGINNFLHGTPYSLNIETYNPKVYKIMSISENYINEYNIFANEFNCDKFKEIEECVSVDNLESTFNYLYSYESASKQTAANKYLDQPYIECLSLIKDPSNAYIQVSWRPNATNTNDLAYKLYIKTPSNSTSNFTDQFNYSDLRQFFKDENLFSYRFKLPNKDMEVGTYTFSLQAFYLDSQIKQFSMCSSRSINILCY